MTGIIPLTTILVTLGTVVEYSHCWSLTTAYTTPFAETDTTNNNITYYMRENYNISLICEYSDLNPGELNYVRWTKYSSDGSAATAMQLYHSGSGVQGELAYGTAATALLSDNMQVLTIVSFNRVRDIGLYQCVACDITDSCRSDTVSLLSIHVVVEPVIDISAEHTTIVEGDSLQLHCDAVGGYPGSVLAYSWGFHGAYGDYLVDIEDTQSSIWINDAAYEDYGNYYCTAQMTGGQFTSHITIQVNYAPQIIEQSPVIILSSFGNAVSFNATFRAYPNNDLSIVWTVTNSYGILTFDEDQITLHQQSEADMFSSISDVSRIDPRDVGTIRCSISNGVGESGIKTFTLAIEAPVINQQSLTYTRSGSIVTLSWFSPTGFYTDIAIDQCLNTTSLITGQIMISCTEIALDSSRLKTVDISEAPVSNGGSSTTVAYLYYMVVYQYTVQVTRSDQFTLVDGSEDDVSSGTSYAVIAGVTAIGVILLVVLVPLFLVYVFDCECTDGEKDKDSSTFQKILKRFRRSRRRQSMRVNDLKETEQKSEEVKVDKTEEKAASITTTVPKEPSITITVAPAQPSTQDNPPAGKVIPLGSKSSPRATGTTTMLTPSQRTRQLTDDQVRKLAANIKTTSNSQAMPKQPAKSVPHQPQNLSSVTNNIQKKQNPKPGIQEGGRKLTPVYELVNSHEEVVEKEEKCSNLNLPKSSSQPPSIASTGKGSRNLIQVRTWSRDSSFFGDSELGSIMESVDTYTNKDIEEEEDDRESVSGDSLNTMNTETDVFSYVQRRNAKLNEEQVDQTTPQTEKKPEKKSNVNKFLQNLKEPSSNEVVHAWNCDDFDVDTDSTKIHVYDL